MGFSNALATTNDCCCFVVWTTLLKQWWSIVFPHQCCLLQHRTNIMVQPTMLWQIVRLLPVKTHVPFSYYLSSIISSYRNWRRGLYEDFAEDHGLHPQLYPTAWNLITSREEIVQSCIYMNRFPSTLWKQTPILQKFQTHAEVAFVAGENEADN